MTATEILSELASRGVTITTSGDKLRLKPADLLTPELLETVRQHKAEIIATIGDPYAERLDAALRMVCTHDYPVGMIQWLGNHRTDLYNLVINAIPDKLHRIWASNGPLEQFDAAIATWKDTHAEAVRAYRAANGDCK